MRDASLLILAAGIGSRYGGLKQIDRLGPSGERIIDYSVYDAIRTGFKKIIFVIRREIEEEFKNTIIKDVSKYIEVDYVFQDLETFLPEEYSIPSSRVKPWGTGHAVLCAKDKINEPFAVINSDDFYGYDAFCQIKNRLQNIKDNQANEFYLVGYLLKNTLSEYGSVARGICSINESGYLQSINEQKKVFSSKGEIYYEDDIGNKIELLPETLVSMNFWGFTPIIFSYLNDLFKEFISENINDEKSEFYLPTAVDTLINRNLCKVKILPTKAEWFGVTYKEDRQKVVEKLLKLIDQKKYPTPLWL